MVEQSSADTEWWRHAVVYQVYPRSFADSDGDGMGDLPGILAHLDHLVDLGVDALWLSPFYPSPQSDGGYDVADHRDVDPMFGTLDDARRLITAAHDAGLRLIVDLVPNHTSDHHPWFTAAIQSGPGSSERGRYLFRDGRGAAGDEPPNNWRSVFGGSAWTRVEEPDGTPGQWYLHLFDISQPDLDWSNPEVHTEFIRTLTFWLDLGVDGFRVDVAHGMAKAAGLPDWTEQPGPTPTGPMWDQDDVHAIIREWRTVIDSYPNNRILVAEAWVDPPDRLARYLRPGEMHQSFNFPYLEAGWDAQGMAQVITRSLAANDAVGATTTWVLSNHDVVRHTSRFGLSDPRRRPVGIGAEDEQPDPVLGLHRARAATLLVLALPGSAYLFQGEELGLPEHTTLPNEFRQDPAFFRSNGAELGRDGCRVPLPWRSDALAFGFSPTGRTWLPQPGTFADLAVDRQTEDPDSTLTMYRSALALRREYRFGQGTLTWSEHPTERDVISVINQGVLVMTNLGPRSVPIPEGWAVLLSSTPTQGSVGCDTTVWLVQD